MTVIRRRMALGTRLAIGSAAITAVVVAASGAAVLYGSWWSATASLDRRLSEQLSMVELLKAGKVPLPRLPDGRLMAPPKIAGGVFIRVIDQAGTIQGPTADLPAATTRPPPDGLPHWVSDGQRHYRALAVVLPEGGMINTLFLLGKGPLTLEIYYDAQAAIDEIRTIAALVVLLWLISTVVVGLVTWSLHRILIAPIGHLAHRFDTIEAERLDTRLDDDVPRELQPIVLRANELLTRLETAFNREKATIATIAHELRTPITVQRGFLEFALLDHGPVDRATLQRCLDAAIGMHRLVDDLLSLARLESGIETLQPVPMPLLAALESAWAGHRLRASGRGITLDLARDRDLIALSDPHRTQAVLANLLGNAVDHAVPTDTISVVLSEAPAQVIVRITNHVMTSGGAGGRHLGVGLPLCHRVMTVLGGTLRLARGQDEEGPVFLVEASFPRAERS
jgi:signal transduction histidine kinase